MKAAMSGCQEILNEKDGLTDGAFGYAFKAEGWSV